MGTIICYNTRIPGIICRMKIFGYLALSFLVARTDAKGNKKPIELSKEGKKIFGDVEKILGGMAELFRGLDKIDKKDYEANANGMVKWEYKIKAQFDTRMKKCGSDYYDDDKEFELNFVNTKGNTCQKFAAMKVDLVQWSEKYLDSCQKPPEKPGKPPKTIKSYFKSIELKFKRVVAAYNGGAAQQGGADDMGDQNDAPLCNCQHVCVITPVNNCQDVCVFN